MEGMAKKASVKPAQYNRSTLSVKTGVTGAKSHNSQPGNITYGKWDTIIPGRHNRTRAFTTYLFAKH